MNRKIDYNSKSTLLALLTCSIVSCGGGEDDSAERVKLPQTVVTYENTDLAIGTSRETVTAESQSSQVFPATELPFDPSNDNENENGQKTTVDIRSRCTSKTFTLEANPREIVMYDIDGNLSWPGAILQGDQYRNGTLRLLSVDSKFRKPISVSVSNLFTDSGSTSKTIDTPSFTEVNDAIKSVIGDAFKSDIPTGNSTVLKITQTKDLKSFFLKAGFSGKTNYGVGKVKAELESSIGGSRNQQNLVIQLTQKMFDVEVQQPPKPEDWFTDSFFTQELKQLKSKLEIGDDNPPVYVSKVTFGRMVTATISSTSSKADIEAMIKLSYKALTSDGTVTLNSKLQSVLENSQKSLVSLGGNSALAQSALNSGNWSEFFSTNIEVTEAVPLMVSFKNIHDNSPAGVTEKTEHTEETCEPYVMVDGTYDFQPTQVHAVPEGLSGSNQVKASDVNGDGIQDLVWNSAAGTTNQLYHTIGSASGEFSVEDKVCVASTENATPVQCDFSNGLEDWSAYRLFVADLNADGFKDLLWINPFPAQVANISVRYVLGSAQGYLLNSFGTDTFAYGFPTSARVKDDVKVLDVNGDNRAEIVVRSDVSLFFLKCSGTFDMWIETTRIFSPDFSGDSLVFKPKFSPDEIFCANDMTEDYMNSRTKQWFSDIDGDGKLDVVTNHKAVSHLDTKQRHNQVKGGLFNGFNYETRKDLDTDNLVNVANSGHSLKNKAFWEDSVTVLGKFTGLGTSMAWINRNSGDLESIYFDNSSKEWAESARVTAFLDFTTFPDLAGKLATNDNLLALDFNDDQFDDLSFIALNNTELWIGSALSAKKSTGPLFNSASVSFQKHPSARDWAPVDKWFTGKFDGDRLDDIVMVKTGNPGKIYVMRAKPDDI